DAEALHWRFGRGVANGDVWVHTLGGHDRVSAYIILIRASDGGLERVRLVDYQDRGPTMSRTAALLASVLERCRDEAIDVLHAVGLAPAARRRFVALGGYPRRMAPLMFYFKAAAPDLQPALEAPGGWSPSPYDGDGHCGTPAFFGLAQ